MFRVSAEVTFVRGDLSVFPLGGFTGGPRMFYFSLEGCPPGVPTGTNTKGTSPKGHFCASWNVAGPDLLRMPQSSSCCQTYVGGWGLGLPPTYKPQCPKYGSISWGGDSTMREYRLSRVLLLNPTYIYMRHLLGWLK